ncbi:MAG: LamG domain-containing protein [Verrucomicrobia bacterium]|nr:LamG domain-containing protein [Verrucomicrobiota bacterium]
MKRQSINDSKVILTLRVLVVLVITSSTIWATTPTPVLHYAFDDGAGVVGAADTGVAPAANGAFNGSATRTTSTPNGSGYAVDLSTSGAGDYVYNHDNPAKLNGMSNITMTCWINLQGNQSTSDRFMSKFSTTAGFDFRLNNANATSAQLIFELNTNSGSSALSSANINAFNQWVFVAVTYDGSGITNSQVNFYSGLTNVAASQLGTAQNINVVHGPGILDTTNDFRVGSTAASTADRTPPAWIDDVRVYNTVLSALDIEAVRAQGGFPSPLSFLVKPVGQTVYPYPFTTNVTFSALPSSTPNFLQWYFNGTNAANVISGATNNTLTLINPTAAVAGTYYIVASNGTGVAVSAAGLTMIVTNSGRLANIWNLLPGDRPYVSMSGIANFERGLAYDAFPAVGTSGDLLLMSTATTNLVVLNATNGAEKYFMNLAGNVVNTVGVADDGKVYGANVTANAASASYGLFQWTVDDSSSSPSSAFFGDPGNPSVPGLRWGDNLAVRGAGTDTQILIASSLGTNLCLFTTTDGANFSLTIITVSNVPSGFATYGIAFGPNPNTFWAKTRGQQLYLVQYDTNSWFGRPIYSSFTSPSLFRFISTDSKQKWMAGVTTLTTAQPDIVSLFDMTSLPADPVWVEGAPYATTNRSTFLNGNGTGVTVFGSNNGNNYLFALDSNNGIKAFLITTNLLAYKITGVQPLTGENVALTWQSISNHTYQVQSSTNLTSGWLNLGSPVTASGTQTSATNAMVQPAQFFRVSGQ